MEVALIEFHTGSLILKRNNRNFENIVCAELFLSPAKIVSGTNLLKISPKGENLNKILNFTERML